MSQIRYKDSYKYQLHDSYTISVPITPDVSINTGYIVLTCSGELTISKGYAWDGCSGPTWDDCTNMRGGLIHDALYQLMREGHLSQAFRPAADMTLKNICLEDGMNSIRAWLYHKAVKLFGQKFSEKRAEEVLTAP